MAVLLSAAISVGPLAFTPLAAVGTQLKVEELSLSTHEGDPGTSVSVTGTGFEACGRATLTFDGQHATPATVNVPQISGTIVVPQDATAGPDHTIEAACDPDVDSGNAYHAEAPFTVTSGGGTTPAETRTLTLDPDHGPVGTRIDVQGKGFTQCSAQSVDLYVVGGTTIKSEIAVADNGDFSYTEVVPSEAIPNTYTFQAACTGEPDIYADADLVVESPANPVLTLDPARGAKNATVQADGTGFSCPDVDFQWDGGEPPFAAAPAADSDTFTAEITVPADAQPGAHTVRAVCTAYPEQYAEAPFTVTDEGGTETGGTETGGTDTGGTETGGTETGGTGTGGTDNTSAVAWVVGPASLGGALILAIAAAVYFGRLHRGPRWVRGHVRATLRPATATADLTEQSPSGEPPTRTIRLDPHADPGSSTIDEVDR
ncbi:hypothetical protein [Streptomyces sp. NPDC059994]|uniref:hypothetical protein n=1 Tax=Streptomyces sp. NPDC059994 TaxID=3347029 RepID=UPI00367C7C8A